MKISNWKLVNLCKNYVTFKTFILFHHIAKSMLLKEIFHYFIFTFYVKITKNDNFVIPSSVES